MPDPQFVVVVAVMFDMTHLKNFSVIFLLTSPYLAWGVWSGVSFTTMFVVVNDGAAVWARPGWQFTNPIYDMC